MNTTNNIESKKLMSMDEDSKIMYIVESVLGATSESTSVTLEQVIEKGIELGVTETYPRGKMDGHPWSPRTSVMMGVGSETAIDAHEEWDLHRKKMKRNGRRSCFFYWVDRTKRHEYVPNSKKATKKSKQQCTEFKLPTVTHQLSMEEKQNRLEEKPDQFIMIGDKLISKNWTLSHPDKFKALYGEVSL